MEPRYNAYTDTPQSLQDSWILLLQQDFLNRPTESVSCTLDLMLTITASIIIRL